LLARSASSSTALSIARVLSVSLSSLDSLAGLTGACSSGFDLAGGGARTGAGLLAGDFDEAAESAGSEMLIFAPQRLHRTTSRLPLTLSSAMWSVARQFSQVKCI